MRRLVVFCDGTWNDKANKDKGRDARTNVRRLFEKLVPGDDQRATYIEGVGTAGKLVGPLLGGVFGVGLKRDIRQGYQWLAENWDEGDEIYIFGFSRGAYTARSIAGMVAAKGVLDLRHEPDRLRREQVTLSLMSQARSRAFGGSYGSVPAHLAARPATVTYLGVWDTVGSLGIPTDLGWLRHWLGMRGRHRFADTYLHKGVLCARHAVAIDERRVDFTPTLWRSDPDVSSASRSTGDWDGIEQRWFSGAHSDVGGGRFERGLSDLTLRWVAEPAQDLGLRLTADLAADHPGDPMTAHLPFKDHGIFVHRPSRVRAVPLLPTSPWVAEPARQKHAATARGDAPYWPSRVLAPGESHAATVRARERWNESGVHVEAGKTYAITATGQWTDKKYTCDANGMPAEVTGRKWAFRLAGLLERWQKKLWAKGQLDADLKLTRRDPEQNWFALMGAVASGEGITQEAAFAEDHEMIHVGTSVTGWTPATSGYLYFFANDGTWVYGNNKGQLEVTITRL